MLGDRAYDLFLWIAVLDRACRWPHITTLSTAIVFILLCVLTQHPARFKQCPLLLLVVNHNPRCKVLEPVDRPPREAQANDCVAREYDVSVQLVQKDGRGEYFE